ncbi:MAG TPA: hypothetical protein VNM90_11550, partial [Haliangium sp.]|nr:hypothetical protein [Haliangium sp.]
MISGTSGTSGEPVMEAMGPAVRPGLAWLACSVLAVTLAGCVGCRNVNRADETPPPPPGELQGKLRTPPG